MISNAEKEIYHALGDLTKRKDAWKENIPYVYSLLDNSSVRIRAKALWILGEMGLLHPDEITPCAEKIASYLDAEEDILRERALNALGRIGRGRFETVQPYLGRMLHYAADECPNVRLAFIWASENIATNAPDAYADHLPLFAPLLHDGDDRVRMEAPEMFRVMGKRRPQLVQPYLNALQQIADTDPHSVVRIHASGAIRATILRSEGSRN